MTSNHIVTLREDFSAPLRRINGKSNYLPRKHISEITRKMSSSTLTDATNDVNKTNLKLFFFQILPEYFFLDRRRFQQ